MAALSTLITPPQPNLLHPTTAKSYLSIQSKILLATLKSVPVSLCKSPYIFSVSHFKLRRRDSSTRLRLFAITAEEATSAEPTSEAARRLYIGNIPRNVDNEELTRIVQDHGAVEKAEVMYDKYSGRSRRFAFVTMKTVEDANAAIEKLNGTEIGGREIKVNITEKPLTSIDASLLQTEESQFIDSPHKVYVGNLSKTVTTETLKKFFSEKGKVLSAKVSRLPGTSKSSGFGFVTFSSEEDVEAAITYFNDSLLELEGQKIRVNKA